MSGPVLGSVVGVGIDVADPARFERLAARGDRMWSHWYTDAEAEACLADRRPGTAAALRFAVKEATYKAVGASFAGPLAWRDVEVLGREASWRVRLHGGVVADAAAAGVERLHVSTSRLHAAVMAVVVAEGRRRVPSPLLVTSLRGPTAGR